MLCQLHTARAVERAPSLTANSLARQPRCTMQTNARGPHVSPDCQARKCTPPAHSTCGQHFASPQRHQSRPQMLAIAGKRVFGVRGESRIELIDLGGQPLADGLQKGFHRLNDLLPGTSSACTGNAIALDFGFSGQHSRRNLKSPHNRVKLVVPERHTSFRFRLSRPRTILRPCRPWNRNSPSIHRSRK